MHACVISITCDNAATASQFLAKHIKECLYDPDE
jgi:hypothetical protein